MQLADDRQLAGADVSSLVTCFMLPPVTNVHYKTQRLKLIQTQGFVSPASIGAAMF